MIINFMSAKNDQMYKGSMCMHAYQPGDLLCPNLVFTTYFNLMKFQPKDTLAFLNCRIRTYRGLTTSKPGELLSYTTSLSDTKKFLHGKGLVGSFSEKSLKASGVSTALDNDVPLADLMCFGRWRSLETPLHYHSSSKKRKMAISNIIS